MNLFQKSIPRVQLPIPPVQIALVEVLKKTLTAPFNCLSIECNLKNGALDRQTINQ